MRRRRLPAIQVVWVVIGMALFRNRSIDEVVDKLDLALPSSDGNPTVARSAVSQARTRLGDEPMQRLFRRSANVWAHSRAGKDRWRGLALYGLDGTTLRVPDTEENREHFGLASGGHRGDSAYPLVRLVALMALRSHLLVDAEFGPYKKGEYTYASNLWSEVPDHSVTIIDKNFLSAAILLGQQEAGTQRHWLIPAKSSTKWRVLKRFSENDELVEMKVSKTARSKDPSLPETWTARAIHYQRKGYPPRTLLTSLLDPILFCAKEIVGLYHERWEIELGYGEVKTKMLNSTNQPLRSKSPQRVRQEIWGILIAYNLVRLEMARVADEAGVSPTRISFVAVYRMICDEFLWCAIASPGAVPRHLRNLRAQIQKFILPERRSHRAYRREVKVKMSNYPKKHRPQAKATK